MKFFSLISNLIECILIMFIVLDFNTPYAYALNKNYYLTEIIVICILVLFFITILRYKIEISMFKKWLLVYIPYYVLMILFFFISVNRDKWINFIARFWIAIPLLTIVLCIYQKNGDIYRLLKKFSRIMFCLSVVSLFFWWFGSQLHLISPTSTIRAYWGIEYNYPSYYGLYFERQTDNFLWISGFRNIGIFCEGPMFSLCLIVALFTELFLYEDIKQKFIRINGNKVYLRTKNSGLKRRIIILVLAITLFTTTTTTGMIIFIFMFIMKYVLTGTNNKMKKIFKWIFGIIIVILGIYLMRSLFVDKSDSVSWKIRLDDFHIGAKAWLKSPILGNGYGEWTVLENLMNGSIRTNNGFSNAIFTVLSQGGLVLFSLYIISILCYFMYTIKNKDKRIFVFGSIFLVEFVVTLFQYTFLMMLLLSLGYALVISNNNKPTIKGKYVNNPRNIENK